MPICGGGMHFGQNTPPRQRNNADSLVGPLARLTLHADGAFRLPMASSPRHKHATANTLDASPASQANARETTQPAMRKTDMERRTSGEGLRSRGRSRLKWLEDGARQEERNCRASVRHIHRHRNAFKIAPRQFAPVPDSCRSDNSSRRRNFQSFRLLQRTEDPCWRASPLLSQPHLPKCPAW